MTDVLTPKQRLLRRAWLFERLPDILTEATFHRVHEELEGRNTYVLWEYGAPRGSLPLGDVRTDWQGLCDRLVRLEMDPAQAGHVLGWLAMNSFQGLMPFISVEGSEPLLRWAINSIPHVRVRPATVLIDEVEHPWRCDYVTGLFAEIRQGSRVVS